MNLMRFNKSECKALHLGCGNPCYQYRMGAVRMEHTPLPKRISRYLWLMRRTWANNVPSQGSWSGWHLSNVVNQVKWFYEMMFRSAADIWKRLRFYQKPEVSWSNATVDILHLLLCFKVSFHFRHVKKLKFCVPTKLIPRNLALKWCRNFVVSDTKYVFSASLHQRK